MEGIYGALETFTILSAKDFLFTIFTILLENRVMFICENLQILTKCMYNII
jgi:hypothetical protein